MSAVCVWDFTLKHDAIKFRPLLATLREQCKKYAFQLEEGKSGYMHYQGRFSLKIKRRLTGVKKLFPNEIHLSITSNENRNNMFYVMKEETRVDGPWTDMEKPTYIPRQIREIKKLYPWQQHIVDTYDEWDTRTINVIYDLEGNNGKSTLCGYMRAHKIGFVLPFINDYKDIMRMIMCVPTKRCYLMDMPRAINKDRLYQMYGAIETIKNGYAYDDRYHFKEKCFDCPNIWIFCNVLPDRTMLSEDRWKIWTIDEDKKLSPYSFSTE